MKKKTKDAFLMLYPNCSITLGNQRALLQNNARKTIDLVPLELASIVADASQLKIAEIYEQYEVREHPVVDGYLDFLITNGYAFISAADTFVNHYKEVSTCWDMPFAFTNAIIDYNDALKNELVKAALELTDLGCHTLQVRFINKETNEVILSFLDSVYASKKLSGISVVIDFKSSGFELNEHLDDLVSKYPVISEIILYNSTVDKFYENERLRFRVLKITSGIGKHSCGVIDPFYFSANIQHFTESLAHNTCLNRKIAIDTEGNIKNCPSMQETFGNIKDTTLHEAYNIPGFKKYWNIKKDDISKCKDCEFRHVCTDCRAYLDNPDDIYSAPLKCGYDPYTCAWETWSTNPLKQAAIHYYQMDL